MIITTACSCWRQKYMD